MIETLIKLHKTDFVIYEVALLVVFCWWYWTLFLGGAKKWSEGIIQAWGKLAFKPLIRPIILKLVMTIFLSATLGGGYGIIMNKFKSF